jgi:hypothetical protein
MLPRSTPNPSFLSLFTLHIMTKLRNYETAKLKAYNLRSRFLIPLPHCTSRNDENTKLRNYEINSHASMHNRHLAS